MVWSRWKMMAGVLSVSLGGLATVAGQCPKSDANKGLKNPVELEMFTDVPAIPGPTLPESSAKAPPAAPAGPIMPTPAAPAGPTMPTPTIAGRAYYNSTDSYNGAGAPAVPPVTPPALPSADVLPSFPGAPAMPASPSLPAKGPDLPSPPAPIGMPSATVPVPEVQSRKHEDKPSVPAMPMIAPTVVPASGTLLPPAPSSEPVKPAAPSTPALPSFPTIQPAAGIPEPQKPTTPAAPSAAKPAVPAFDSGTPVLPPSATPAVEPPAAVVKPSPAVVPASSVSVSATKFRIVLRVGEGEPTFEVRSGDDLLLKVQCEKVDIKSPEKGVGPSVVKAVGRVRFIGFGAEGTCEELTFLAGTGVVDMAGQVKIQVKDKLGRVESELSTETMKYKLDPTATGSIKP